jgi:hypothetical protein
MNEPGECNYNFRIYGRKDAGPEERAQAQANVALFRKVALEEDLPAQVSCQLMMEQGAVPSLVFGKSESALTGMHKMYDQLIGHDASLALRNNAAAMGVSRTA